MKSLYLGETTKQFNHRSFCQWLLEQDKGFKNATQALREYLTTQTKFIYGLDFISLKSYVRARDSFKQLTVKV